MQEATTDEQKQQTIPRPRKRILCGICCFCAVVVFILPSVYIVAGAARCTFQSTTAAVTLETALAKYKTDHGTYPDSECDLVPKYLSSIPTGIMDYEHVTEGRDGYSFMFGTAGLFLPWEDFYSSDHPMVPQPETKIPGP